MKTDLFQSCGHCWGFQICWHIECSTFTASSFRIWNSSTGIPSPPLALFVVMLPKAHLTSHSRMSGSRWVITPSWLSGSWRSFLYSSSVYSCLLFLISSASVRSIPFLSFIVPSYTPTKIKWAECWGVKRDYLGWLTKDNELLIPEAKQWKIIKHFQDSSHFRQDSLVILVTRLVPRKPPHTSTPNSAHTTLGNLSRGRLANRSKCPHVGDGILIGIHRPLYRVDRSFPFQNCKGNSNIQISA